MELAVIMPILIVLILVPIQVALWWHAQQTVSVAAEQGVSAATADGTVFAEAGVAEIVNASSVLGDVSVDVTTTDDTVTVRVSGDLAWSVIGTHRVSSTATGPIEQFIPVPDR